MSARDLQDARVNARAMSTRWEEWAYRLNAEGEAKYKEEYTAFLPAVGARLFSAFVL